MNEVFDNLTARISGNRIIRAIRRGMLYMMPMVLIGSIMLTVLNLPLADFQRLMNTLLSGHWREVALAIHNGTFQVLALLSLISVSYTYANEHKVVQTGEISVISVILCAFMSFFSFNMEADLIITAQNARSTGMFGAIVVAIISTRVLIFFYEKGIARMRLAGRDAILMSSVKMLLPSLLTAACFALARLFLQLTGLSGAFGSAYGSLFAMLGSYPNKLLVAFLYILLIQVLWFCGLHGTNLMEQPVYDLFMAASDTNMALAEAGQAPTEILTKEFLDTFVFLGGCGATLGLLLTLLFAARRTNFSRIARFSLFPGVFNINEMMVYGLPIIFNPYYLVPFILSPMVLATTTYLAMGSGLVPLTFASV